MTGLTSALSNALAGLLVSSGQSAVVSRNITNANDENYAREVAVPVTNIDGTVRLAQIQRSSEKQLTDALLKATSDATAQSTVLGAYNTLSNTVGDVQSDGSVAWGIDQLQQALQGAESDPSNNAYATQAVARAGTLALSFVIEPHGEAEHLIPEWHAAWYVSHDPGHCIPVLALKSVLQDERFSGDWVDVALHRMGVFRLPRAKALDALRPRTKE